MKSVIYARVSSTEQVSGYSIDAQVDLCREWAAQQGYTVVHIYIEPGKSAKTDERPVFQQMIRYVSAGQAEQIIVHKVDRFARNLLDLLRYKHHLQENGVSILSVTEEFINGASPENQLVAHMMGAVAEYIAYNIGRESIKGQDAKARAGSYPGSHVPLGYQRLGKKRNSYIVTDPAKSPIVIDAFNSFATGKYTLDSWVKEASKRGYTSKNDKAISKSSWQWIFRNIFYTGQFVWRNETYQGDHPSLVSHKTWQAVQDILEERNTGGTENRHFWLLKNLLWSEVHAKAMTGSLVKGQYAYYQAKGRARLDPEGHAIPAESAEQQVIRLLATIRYDGETHLPIPDKWAFGIAVASDLRQCYDQITVKEDQQRFLRMVFLKHSLHVNRANVVSIYKLKPGFEFIGGKS